MTHIQTIPESTSPVTLRDGSSLSVEVSHSIHRVSRTQWAQLESDPLEGYDYYAAVEDAELRGIEPRYFMIRDGQRLIAVAPAYRQRIRLHQVLSGFAQRVLGKVSVPILAVGSPVTETGSIACAPDWLARTPELLQVLIAALHRQSRLEGAWLCLFKDVAQDHFTLRSALQQQQGFARISALPATRLPLPYADLDGYLANLGRNTRKDLKRKLKTESDLRIEARQHQVEDVLDRMLVLYAETVDRSGEEIEPLTAAYFRAVLAKMGDRATCYLFWSGETLIGFNLLLGDDTRQIDKVFACQSDAARAHNLYHRTWLAHVQRCIDQGVPAFEASQAAYAEKIRLGCELVANDHFVSHRTPWMARVLGWLVRKAGLDQPTVLTRGAEHE